MIEGTAWSPTWQIQGDVTATLSLLAHTLRDANIGHVARYWRNELLAVNNARGARVGQGLHLDALGAVQRGGRFTVCRPTGEPDDDGAGYMVEDTDWFECTGARRMYMASALGSYSIFMVLLHIFQICWLP